MVSHSERVLITGASGFTGTHLMERLRQNGYEVIGLGRQMSAGHSFKVDVRDLNSLTRAFTETRPSAIVHLAGIAAPTHGDIGEIYSANVVGTANLFGALVAAKIKPRKIIVASSAQVYATNNERDSLTEESPLAAKTHYAVSKRATEDIARIYLSQFPVIIVRPFNYTGPGQSQTFLVPKIVQHYADRRDEIHVGNLDLFRDISDVRRVVEAYARLISCPIDSTTVNICSGRALHLSDIIKMMQEISGHALKIVTDPSFVRTDDPFMIVGSPSRLESLVGPVPNPELRETLLWMYKSL